jgi:hypothetical protein
MVRVSAVSLPKTAPRLPHGGVRGGSASGGAGSGSAGTWLGLGLLRLGLG